jgi:phage minor structural protein
MQMYGEYHNISPSEYFTMLINYHNAHVEEYKRFKIGKCTVTDNNDSIYRYVAYESTYKNISDDLVDSFDAELWIDYGDGKAPWTINLLAESGVEAKPGIKLGLNMGAMTEKINFSSFATRIIPLGAKLSSDSDGTESEERLTIASVNGGVNYIDIPELQKVYGIIEQVVTYDDVTIASNLLKRGQTYAASMILTVSNTVTAYDLSLAGYDYDSFSVGNYYTLDNANLDIDYQAKLVEKQINIDNPASDTLTFGDHGYDVK